MVPSVSASKLRVELDETLVPVSTQLCAKVSSRKMRQPSELSCHSTPNQLPPWNHSFFSGAKPLGHGRAPLWLPPW